MAITFTPGNTAHVTYGHNTLFNHQTWLISCWINRAGNGTAVSTGSGGTTIEPIIAKGAPQADSPANLNANYIIGWSTSGSNFHADWEDKNNGQNRPWTTSTPVTVNADTWYHLVMGYQKSVRTYYGYFDGSSIGTGVLSGGLTDAQASPEDTCIQHLGIAAMLTSTGSRTGWWNGRVSELYIWTNYVVTAEDVARLYGSGSPKKWVGTTISPSNLVVYSPLDDFANGVTASGGSSVRNYALLLHGTPTNSPQGFTEPLSYSSALFGSTVY